MTVLVMLSRKLELTCVGNLRTTVYSFGVGLVKNIVHFSPNKTQVCAFTVKTSPFLVFLHFKNTSLTALAIICIFGVSISTAFSATATWKARLNRLQKIWVFSAGRDITSYQRIIFSFVRRKSDIIVGLIGLN